MNYNTKILKAAADETRIKILLELTKKEMRVQDVVLAVGKSQPNISIALKKLQEAGLIKFRKDGNKILYKINRIEIVNKILDIAKNE